MSGLVPGVTRRKIFSSACSPNATDELDCSPVNGVDGAVGSSGSPGSRWNASGPSGGKAKARRYAAIASRSWTAS